MDQFAKETIPVSLEEEMRRSYLDYAMSVIVGRLPDVSLSRCTGACCSFELSLEPRSTRRAS